MIAVQGIPANVRGFLVAVPIVHVVEYAVTVAR
jgi:hypothetical protein